MSEDGRFTMEIKSQTDLSDFYTEWEKLKSYMDKSTRDKLTTNNPIAGLIDQGLPLKTLTDSGALDALSVKVRQNLEKQIKSLTLPNITDYTSEIRAQQSSFITSQYDKPFTPQSNQQWKDSYNVQQEYAKALKDRTQVLMASPDTSVQEFKDLADNISVFRRELANLTAAAAGQGRTTAAGKFTALDNATNTGSQFDLVTAKEDILERARIIKIADADYFRMRDEALKKNSEFEQTQMVGAFAENKHLDEQIKSANMGMLTDASDEDKRRTTTLHTAEVDHVTAIKINDAMDKETSDLKASAARETLRQNLAATSPATTQSAGALPYLQSAIANGGSQADLLKAANQYADSLGTSVNDANSALIKTQGSSQNVLSSMKGIYGAMVMSRGILYSIMGGQSAWMQLARQGSQAIYSSVYAYSLLDGQASKVTETLVKHREEYITNQRLLGTVAAAQQTLTLAKEVDLTTTTAIGALENKIASDKGQIAIATLAKNAEEVAIKQKTLDIDVADLVAKQETKVAQDGIVASATANLAAEKVTQGAAGIALKGVTAGISSVVAPIMSIVAGAAAVGMFLFQAIQWIKQLNINTEISAAKFRVVSNQVQGLNKELSKAPTGTISDVQGMITYATAAKEINSVYLKMSNGLSDAEKAGIAFWLVMDRGSHQAQIQLEKLNGQLAVAKSQMEPLVFTPSASQNFSLTPAPTTDEAKRNFEDLTILVQNYQTVITSGKDSLLEYQNRILGVSAAINGQIKTSADWVAANKEFFFSNIRAEAAESDRTKVTKDATGALKILADAEGGPTTMNALYGSINGTQQLIEATIAHGEAVLDALPAERAHLALLQGIAGFYGEPTTPQEIAAYNATNKGSLYTTSSQLVQAGGGNKALTEQQRQTAIAAQKENIKQLQAAVDTESMIANPNTDTVTSNYADKPLNATLVKNKQDLENAKLALYNLQHPPVTAAAAAASSATANMTMLDYTKSMFDNYQSAYTSQGSTDKNLEALMKSWRAKYATALRNDIVAQQKLVLQYGDSSQKGMVANVQLTSDTAQLQDILKLTNQINSASATWFNIPGSIIKPTASIINQIYVDGKFVTQTANTSKADLQKIVKTAIADFERTHITGAGNMHADEAGTT